MANPLRGLGEVLGSLLHPNRAADVIRMAEADPALAARLMEAAEAQDFGKSLRTLVFDLQRGRAPARQVPAAQQPEVVTFAQRLTRNPDVQAQIQSNMDRLPPALAQRVQAGDPDAAVEAYQMIAAADGELPARGVARINDPDSPDYIPDVDMMGFSSSSLADDGVAALIGGQAPPATRQMELPLGGENALPPRGLIPFGVRGPGVPAGGPTGMGTARDVIGELVPAPLRGIPGSVNPSFDLSADVLLRRLAGAQGTPLRIAGPSPVLGLPSPPVYRPAGLPLRSTAARAGDSGAPAARVAASVNDAPSTPAGIPGGRVAAGLAAGTGGTLVGLGLYDLLSDESPGSLSDDVSGGGAEALAAETSPPPVVTPTKEEPAEPPLADVSVRPTAQPAGLPKRPGPDTGFIETNSAYALKPAQQRTLEALLDAGIEPSRAEAIARGQRSLTQAEERAIIANGPARRQRDMDMMEQRRRARMGAY